MRKAVLLAVIAAIVIVSLWAYGLVGRSSEQPSFRLASVQRGPIVSTVSSSGTLNAVTTVKVGSQVSGQIKELLADFNSEVHKGDVIARIDPENFKARVLQAQAELEVSRANVAIQRATVERSRAELRNARAALAAAKAQTNKARVFLRDTKLDLDRKRKLHKKRIIPDSELDRATAAYDQARAQLRAAQAEQRAQESMVSSRQAMLKMTQAQVELALAQVKQKQAALNQARIDLEHTIIRSPLDGIVIGRNVDIGQTVAASLQAPTLFTIAQDLRKMQVETDLDEADIGHVRVGQRATFSVDAFPDEEFEGVVEQVRKEAKTLQNVVTYTVVVSANNPDLRLLPGMTANVKIVIAEEPDTLKVPNASLRFQPKGAGGNLTPASAQLQGGSSTGAERMNRLIEDLELNEKQQAELKAIFSQSRKRIMALRRQGASPAEIQTEIERLRQKGKNEIMAILTPEQQGKFLNIGKTREQRKVVAGRVWILGPDGKPKPVDVITGITDGAFTQIVDGNLRPGQKVIIGASLPLHPSSRAKGKLRF
ncbi:MAG: HlyD family secretion protein [Deltaproteobacteria bacterium]|nr:MAG: HlyD family secretion protein [Deltaproteobacteria bacterium]